MMMMTMMMGTPSPDLVPLPHPFRHLSPGALARFLNTHPDFRYSTLHCITLPSPWLLATTELNHTTVLNTLLPQAHELREGSIWELSSPNSPSWVTQANRTLLVDINQWVLDNARDPWRGLQATTTQAIQRSPSHEAFLDLQAGQTVTILGQPFWCWHDTNMLHGTFVIPVSTFNHATSLTTHHDAIEDPAATLGVVPAQSFLHLS